MMNIKNNNIHYIYMPNRWITFVKNWASSNNIAYGCALSKPELKAAYNKEYPKAIKLPKGVKKLEESKPPADVKSKVTYPNLKIRIPEEQENIQFDMEDMGEEPAIEKKKKGRPQKYMSKEEVYKAKLESNKQKRREARAAKKVKGGMLNEDAVIRGQIEHMGFNIKNLINQKGISNEDKQNENRQSASNAFELLNKLKNPTPQEIAIMNVGKSGIKGTFIDSVMDLPNYYKISDITINRK